MILLQLLKNQPRNSCGWIGLEILRLTLKIRKEETKWAFKKTIAASHKGLSGL